MEFENLHVLLLHKHPQYLKPCCELINEEWPRSETARMMSLQASRDELPTNLVLTNERNQLLGHCKLTAIPTRPDSCFVETVVIAKAVRGLGLGTYLMRSVEKYCKTVLKLKSVYLATKGQESFYAKLSYTVCAPVSIYGSGFPTRINAIVTDDIRREGPVSDVTLPVAPAPPPPPTPPHPTGNDIGNIKNVVNTKKTYMCKTL